VLTNLSFETAGASPGQAASWTWTRTVPFLFEAFVSGTDELGISRFDGFESGWGCDDLITELIIDASSTPATVVAQNPAPYALADGDTITGTVNGGGPQTATFTAAAASILGSLAQNFVLTDGMTFEFAFDREAPILVTFHAGQFVHIGAALAAEVVSVLTTAIAAAGAPGVATATGAHHVDLATTTKGRSSFVQIVGGTALTALGFTAAFIGGTGNVGDISAVTAVEVETVVAGGLVGTSGTLTGDEPTIETSATGPSATLQITGGTANAAINFPTTKATGSAVGSTSAPAVFGPPSMPVNLVESFSRGWRKRNTLATAPSGNVTPWGSMEPFAITDGMTLLINVSGTEAGVPGLYSVGVTFHTADFISIGSALADEVVFAINRAIGAAGVSDAESFADSFGHVFVCSLLDWWQIDPNNTTAGVEASVTFVLGTSLAALGFVAATYSSAIDAAHPGNENARFTFDGGVAAVYNAQSWAVPETSFDGFESGWALTDITQTHFTAWSQVASTAALYGIADETFDNFSIGWNVAPYYTAWHEVSATTANYVTSAGVEPFEDFSEIEEDQAISFTLPSTINLPSNNFSNGDLVTFNSDNRIPTGLNPAITYFVINALTNSFEVAVTSGGSAVVVTDAGAGSIFVKANPALFWTLFW
jgi:hypothetical protein